MDESDDPPEMSTRRGWLSALARTARSRAQEVSDAVGPGGLPGLLNEPGQSVRDGGGREPARAPDRAVSVDELIALAHDEGLTRHDDAIRSLARLSLRMTPVVPRCAEAWIETSDSWVDTPGSELLLAQINLGAASAPRHRIADRRLAGPVRELRCRRGRRAVIPRAWRAARPARRGDRRRRADGARPGDGASAAVARGRPGG